MIVGAGSISLKKERFYDTSERDTYFIAEPGANFIINFSKHIRAGIGFGYRLAYDFEFSGMDNPDMTGPSYGIFAISGKF